MSAPAPEFQDSARIAYLRALGIEVWVPRALEPSGQPASVEAPAAATAAASAVRAPVVARPSVKVPSVELPTAELPTSEWGHLKAEVSGCVRCGLASTRTQTVFGVGPERAEWLIIGEAPGAEEDRRGEPFVGKGGQLLDAMLHSIGVRRGQNAFIANILKCRPPNNRDPKADEVAACMPYLMRQIRLIRPRVILAVGRIAAQNLLGTDAPLGRLRGRAHSFGELNTPLVVTYHPAYLLRTPADKRKAWDDLKFARSVFAQQTAAATQTVGVS